jgi:phosphocarrier protein FPr
VPATSLSRLATLGALNGHEIEARAHGPRAREALKELSALAERNFDDPGSPAQPDLAPDRAGPLPASPGIGIGPALVLAGFDDLAGLGQVPAAGEQDERRSLDSAITAVRAQIEQVRGRVSREVGEAEAAIFDAHLALLADPEIVDGTRSRIGEGQPAAQAWAEAIRQVEAEFRALSDPYLKARAADVRAVGHQVLAELTGSTKAVDKSGYSDHVVLVAADLTPAQAATLDPDLISAVVLAFGSPTAHSAILVRARGIPAVVGAGPGLLRIDDGTPLAVDGSTGELIINPSDAELSEFRARSTAAQVRRQQAIADAATAADTEDGVRILVGANVGSVDDAHAAAASGADLIGLVRTEFLFLGRTKAPDVEEQETVYRALAEAAAGLRITLRTLDVGGDKPLDYLPMPAEANPFLGVRGIRLALQRPQLLADQLFAIIRVAHDVPVSVMFPMVSTLAELISARRMLDDAIRSVGTGPPAGLQVGIMVEVPAAALKAATFAPHVDFLSIGTNDLTQYTLAAERGNDAVALLGDPLDPGVLKLIDATCRGAGHAVVAVCGELAADERAARVLAGLGVRELSVSPRAVPGVKQAVREVRLADAEALAGRALAASSAAAVHTLLAEPSLNRH